MIHLIMQYKPTKEEATVIGMLESRILETLKLNEDFIFDAEDKLDIFPRYNILLHNISKRGVEGEYYYGGRKGLASILLHLQNPFWIELL